MSGESGYSGRLDSNPKNRRPDPSLSTRPLHHHNNNNNKSNGVKLRVSPLPSCIPIPFVTPIRILSCSLIMDHLLTLKVMRLTRPTLSTSSSSFSCTSSLYVDSHRDLLSPLTDISLNVNGEKDNVFNDNLGLGSCLVLPQSFGSIYLGETFVCYVSLHNDSATQSCVDVCLKCDLQTATQRIPVHCTEKDDQDFLSGTSMDRVLSHEVKELGTHILVCEVSYNVKEESSNNTSDNRKGEKMSFRKFFKFQVLKPLDVRTKFYNAESDEVFLEAQVENATHAPLCLDRVHLDPSPLFDVHPLNEINSGQSVFGKVNSIRPQDSRQYLFCLMPKKEVKIKPKLIKGVTNIGKLDIVWRTNMGDRGRLQTNQLQRMAPTHGDVRVVIESVPSVVKLQELFTIHATVVNNGDNKLQLELQLDNNASDSAFSWCGTSREKLEELASSSTLYMQLHAVPHQTGLLSFGGIGFLDVISKKTYSFDNVCQVYVCEDPRLITALKES